MKIRKNLGGGGRGGDGWVRGGGGMIGSGGEGGGLGVREDVTEK